MYVNVSTQIATGSRDGTACSGEVQLTSCQSLGFPHCAPALLEATQVTIAPLCVPKSHDKTGKEAAAVSGFITLQGDAHVWSHGWTLAAQVGCAGTRAPALLALPGGRQADST
jgi:hypothetical protein